MKSSTRLNILILIAFLIAALAYLFYRWANDAEERQKIYGFSPNTAVTSQHDNSIA